MFHTCLYIYGRSVVGDLHFLRAPRSRVKTYKHTIQQHHTRSQSHQRRRRVQGVCISLLFMVLLYYYHCVPMVVCTGTAHTAPQQRASSDIDAFLYMYRRDLRRFPYTKIYTIYSDLICLLGISVLGSFFLYSGQVSYLYVTCCVYVLDYVFFCAHSAAVPIGMALCVPHRHTRNETTIGTWATFLYSQ